LMTKIPHLKPPYRVNPVVIDRYSPYFEHFRSYGFDRPVPIPTYRAAHPHLDDATLHDIAYHFEAGGGDLSDEYLDRFCDAVARWKARYERQDGLYWNRHDGLTRITDGAVENIAVGERIKRVIESTHRIAPLQGVVDRTGCEPSLIEEMIDHGFLYEENGNLVNLAVRIR
jgi:hypothetical protein